MNNITISFATTVWNEHEELNRLLGQLISILGPDDEIVIQGDQGKVTDQVVSVLHRHRKNPQVKYIEYPLKKDFAAYKNNLFKNCEKDYIVNIDADELLSDEIASILREFIELNLDIDVFRMPRVNVVEGLTEDYIRRMRWNVNEQNWVNWPDYQCRIVKNTGKIKWINPVHEVLSEFNSIADLPANSEHALIHVKSIDRQIKQNDFYSTFQSQAR